MDDPLANLGASAKQHDVPPNIGLVGLPSRKSDAEVAALHKAALTEVLKPVMAAMDAAKADGFKCAWNVGVDFAGRACITQLVLMKEF